jgi:cytochrome b-561
MDKYDVMEEEQNLRYFSFVFGISQFFGALAVILVAVWMGSYDGGFGWSESPSQQFHYHPLFMAIGFVFLYGEASLVYRVFRHEQKRFTKLLHLTLHSMVFIFLVVALKAVFDSHNLDTPPIPNMYTLHSWVGLGAVLLFSFQLVCGFVTFFFPGLSMPVRSWYLPIHQFFGILIFVLSVSTCLMGISERAAWHVWNKADGNPCKTNKFCSEGMVVNFLGLSVALYGLCVVYLVGNPRFRRRSLPEEESLHQLTAD